MNQIRGQILQMLSEISKTGLPIDDSTHLYTDLAVDSLTFARLLIEIEQAFQITLPLSAMEECLCVGKLVALVEREAGRRCDA